MLSESRMMRLPLYRIALVMLLSAAGGAGILARSTTDDLQLNITIVTGEHSRDSNSTSTTLTVDGNKLFYEQTYHGAHSGGREPVRKEYKLTAEDRNVLIGLLRQRNMLVNKNVSEPSQAKGSSRYFELEIHAGLDGNEASISIDAARNDVKLKNERLYQDSVYLTEQIYKIINRTDPEMTMPELISQPSPRSDTPEQFIQGSWRTEGSDPTHRLSWVLEWTFDHGTFKLSGYPALEQKGNYRILKIEENRLTLELYNQKGNFGAQNAQVEVIIDSGKDTLMIKGQGPFKRKKP